MKTVDLGVEEFVKRKEETTKFSLLRVCVGGSGFGTKNHDFENESR